MDAAGVFRLVSLIPERAARARRGSPFNLDGSAKMELLGRFLHWMGPLSALTKEEQQVLGVRASGGRSIVEGEEDSGDEALEGPDELDEGSLRLHQPGTQIAA